MQAPMDYAAPNGPTITLGLTRVKATDPDKRIGSLIINPGGPGGPGSEILNVVATIQPSLHRQAARVLRPRWL